MTREKSLHRMLIVRIVIVTILVSAIVSVVVIRREQERMHAVARDRALIRSSTIALFMKDQLEAPGLGDHAEIQRMLNVIAYRGFDLSTGHYVFVRVLDPAGHEVAHLEDRNHKDLDDLLQQIGSEQFRLPGMKEGAEFISVRIGGHDYVRSRIPLADSRGEAVAVIEGFFAASPEAERATRRNIINSVTLAIGIVLATALTLYPVIVRLMRRLERLSLNLLDANLEMVSVVGSTIAKRDSDTDAHNFRVTIYAVRVAEALGLNDAMIRVLIKGAFLHDVGKIGVRDNILFKPGKLDDKEFEEMKRHVHHGLDIVFRAEWLKDAAAVVGGHHEKYEGNGYPAGLKGEKIPVLARIFAIADVFDALASHRPYKEPLSYDETIDILMKGRGSHFDPEILDVFVKISWPLFEQYGGADDDRVRKDVADLVGRYFKADVATFFD